MKQDNKREMLDSLLFENHGYLRTADVVAAGISREYLSTYTSRSGLVRVGQGLYRADDAWPDDLYEIAVRYPNAVFSHETALYLLGFSEREPDPYSVTLKAGANTSGLKKDGIKVYSVKEELLCEGLTSAVSPTGHFLRTYDFERTICDLFRSRSGIEIQDLQSAVRAYMRKTNKNIPRLMRFARAFRIEKIVRQYMGVLL